MSPSRALKKLYLSSVATKLAVGLLVGSVVNQLLKLGGAPGALQLVPSDFIGRLALWQPFTYTFVEVEVIGILFGCLIVWQMGGGLEATWGSRKLLWFAVGTTELAGLLTVALSFVWQILYPLPFGGGTVMSSVLWVAYGLSFGTRQMNFWGLPLSGNGFAWLGVGFVGLSALFGHPALVVPEVFGLAMTFAYVKGFSPRLLWLRFTSWRLQRELKSRSKHLRVVGKDRNTGSGSDRFLH
jgi:membrane associated rhomboid family serine protease